MTNNSYTIKFDASLEEENSGACFTIQARDMEHAKLISSWLKSKTKDPVIKLIVSTDVEFML